MKHHNWEHYHLDEENVDSKEFNEGAYGFYDFEDHEVEQMERDRIASLEKPDKADDEPKAEPSVTQAPASETKPYTPEMQQAKETAANYSSTEAEPSIKDDKPQQAAQSFLDNKKYQFKAQ